MGTGLDTKKLSLVFHSRPDILEGIKQAADSPARVTLFNNIASFVHDQIGPEPASKRRRIDDGSSNGIVVASSNGALVSQPTVSGSSNAADEEVLLEIKDISVSIPQRKKYDLCFTANHLYARAPGTKAPIQGIVYAWRDIEYAFYLPVPEKTQVQHNYILFPRGTCMPPKNSTPTIEPLVFTVAATPPKQGTIGGSKASTASSVSDTYRSLFDWAITTHLRSVSNSVDIVASDPAKFHSVVRQAHRPSEKAVHVKAFRGSKDGYLFFLPNGILWGFKKPLMFIPLERIAAVSYTNVLQRTFNVVVEVFAAEGEATEEIEFAMLDQEDYSGIDESYVKRNRLQDRSMVDQRKAKMVLAENLKAAKKNGGMEGDVEMNGQSELEKAQMEAEQLAQDEEDEDEEDYDPGSDGDSGGSGESSEEDDDDDDDEGEEDEEDEEDDEGGEE